MDLLWGLSAVVDADSVDISFEKIAREIISDEDGAVVTRRPRQWLDTVTGKTPVDIEDVKTFVEHRTDMGPFIRRLLHNATRLCIIGIQAQAKVQVTVRIGAKAVGSGAGIFLIDDRLIAPPSVWGTRFDPGHKRDLRLGQQALIMRNLDISVYALERNGATHGAAGPAGPIFQHTVVTVATGVEGEVTGRLVQLPPAEQVWILDGVLSGSRPGQHQSKQ